MVAPHNDTGPVIAPVDNGFFVTINDITGLVPQLFFAATVITLPVIVPAGIVT